MGKKRFIINVFIMSASMLITRTVATITNIYVSSQIGATAMGVYHMIFSVFTFGITIASSGAGFAVTRLVSENRLDKQSILKKGLEVALTMSVVGTIMFFFSAGYLKRHFIHNPMADKALKLLAFSLPCMSVSSVFRGYFIALRKAGRVTACALFEESVCIVSTLIFLKKFSGTSGGYMCLVYGCFLSNVAALIFDGINVYNSVQNVEIRHNKSSLKSILTICIPIALGSYLRTALVALENLMIPMQFAKYGIDNPVGEYGTIKGMAMAVVMFPTVFIQAFSQMLVPEMSEMNAVGRKNGIRHVSNISINTVMLFSVFVSLMLLSHHEVISRSFFKEARVSSYLGLLALLCIPMYLDTVADSILKGLGLQNACLKYNIIDSAIRITAIFLLMPRFGPLFYIAMLYISEIFNLILSLGKASSAANIKVDFSKAVMLPFFGFLSAWRIKNPILQTLMYITVYLVADKFTEKKKIPFPLIGKRYFSMSFV